MNWITKVVRPRIKGLMGGKDGGRGDTPAPTLNHEWRLGRRFYL